MNISTERRIKPRVVCDYPAIVVGYNGEGSKFNEHVKLANLSASGLYMRSNRKIENGSNLAVTILLTNDLMDKNIPKIATYGIVVRSETQSDGTCGIAVKFSSYKFR